MSIDKQVAYWLDSAKEDWQAANQLMQGGMYRHGLFFVHLTMEKTLKAIYSKRLGQVSPKIHNLEKLAEMCGLSLNEEHSRILGVVNAFSLEGRYPETLPVHVDKKQAFEIMKNAEEVYRWLLNRL